MNLNETVQNLLGEFSKNKFYGVQISDWILFLAAAVLLFFLLRILQRILIAHLEHKVDETEYTWDDFIHRVLKSTYVLTLLCFSLYAGSFLIAMPGELRMTLTNIIAIVLLIQAGFWGNASIEQWLTKGLKSLHKSDVAAKTSAAVIKVFAILAVWAIVISLVMANLGFNIGAIVAGLGVGGIAIAFALQKILGDVFNSVAILMDRPFEVGDFIVVGDFLGSVERIGIKTTRLRSLGGEQLIFANTDLIESRIRNYKRMAERRVVFSYGLIYQTTPDKLELAKQIVADVIKGTDKTRFDRAHFKGFGASSLDFEVVYYVLEADYNVYMDTQEKINLALCRRFEKEELSFAYPTQTLYLRGDSPIRIRSEPLSERSQEDAEPNNT